MRKHAIIFITFLFISNFIAAQEFDKAPLPKVKTIIEWTQASQKAKAKKGMVYHFDRTGLLTKFEEGSDDNRSNEIGILKFDDNRKLVSKEIQSGENNKTILYAYNDRYHVEETKFKDSKYKTFFYKNKKGKLEEKKTFISNYDSDYKYQLYERTLYFYDINNRLKSEKHYSHWNVRNKKAKPSIKKTTYEYDPNIGEIISMKEYDYNGKLNNITQYEYDTKNNLKQKILDFLNGTQEVTTFKYQNGKLWTETFETEYLIVTKIYKKNRLIRKRTKFKGGKEKITDFQYVFFK